MESVRFVFVLRHLCIKINFVVSHLSSVVIAVVVAAAATVMHIRLVVGFIFMIAFFVFFCFPNIPIKTNTKETQK